MSNFVGGSFGEKRRRFSEAEPTKRLSGAKTHKAELCGAAKGERGEAERVADCKEAMGRAQRAVADQREAMGRAQRAVADQREAMGRAQRAVADQREAMGRKLV